MSFFVCCSNYYLGTEAPLRLSDTHFKSGGL
uniref:Uncharacterized protein n=1 Tax=Rhizophora mucronata TaxID=61149 RepID=A0A2P2Q0W9_RHIMU